MNTLYSQCIVSVLCMYLLCIIIVICLYFVYVFAMQRSSILEYWNTYVLACRVWCWGHRVGGSWRRESVSSRPEREKASAYQCLRHGRDPISTTG